jgi:hypothetical protein
MNRRYRLTALVALELAMGGCAGTYPKFPEAATDEYRRTKFVVVQFCLPSDSGVEILSMGRVSRWGYDSYQRSASSGARRVLDRTSLNQPVFEDVGANRPIDLVATTARRNELEFIFIPPKEIPAGWTEWLAPTTAAAPHSNASVRIVNGQPFERVEIPAHAPRVRYRLRSYEDQQSEGRQMFGTFRPNNLPPCK